MSARVCRPVVGTWHPTSLLRACPENSSQDLPLNFVMVKSLVKQAKGMLCFSSWRVAG